MTVPILLIIVAMFALSVIALLRCDRKDVPEVVRALAAWWRRPRT
jgi:hypothetical protein